ncbi:hypothetical protein FSP39_013875 [Pinctada imbricata]|uniref:Uncharacterized protein n=1 Tax=Pinctada imbricata TaxID=66713 RepID=A0AA89CAS3_PINIB|nr:hypothetical protein FSP39_013875 [Pinctada imbricata]
MDLWGNVIHVYEFGEDGKTRLFTLPTTAVENKNTDICVVNYIDKESAELIVLKSDGRVKFTYKGDRASGGRNKFCPTDVACDPSSHILFTEFYGRSVEMLSSGGMYLCRLCQYEQIHPYTISLYCNKLACGFLKGKVIMFQYNK